MTTSGIIFAVAGKPLVLGAEEQLPQALELAHAQRVLLARQVELPLQAQRHFGEQRGVNPQGS